MNSQEVLNAESEDHKDELPSDLDITKYVGPYQFPSPRRRRTACYSIVSISCLAIIMGVRSTNSAIIAAGILGILIGVFFFFCAWPLNISDIQALELAASKAPFGVGHASAQLSFSGWLSKPTWRVVVFSSDEPPSQRGLIEINAVSRAIISTYFDNEETEAPRATSGSAGDAIKTHKERSEERPRATSGSAGDAMKTQTRSPDA